MSFIGSTPVAQSVYARSAGNGKRVQCMGGAKNHGVILPDADLDQVLTDTASSSPLVKPVTCLPFTSGSPLYFTF